MSGIEWVLGGGISIHFFCCIKLRRNGNINITDDGRVSLFSLFSLL